MTTFMSTESKARREADLERMRAKWSREKRGVRRSNGKQELLKLSDLARACRVAKVVVQNDALKAHLEIAATYFDEAETK